MKKVYVVGFAFSPAKNAVALILKSNATNAAGEKRPDWLQGKFNGIGKDLTEDDKDKTAEQVMSDTFAARTGAVVPAENWKRYHVIDTTKAKVMFFFSVLDAIRWQQIRKITAEEVRKVNIANMGAVQMVNNLKWLIPMALDSSHAISTSIDTNSGDIADPTTQHAWDTFRAGTAEHMQPENLIPADELAATPTTDQLFVALTPRSVIVEGFKAIVSNVLQGFEGQPNSEETGKAINAAVAGEIEGIMNDMRSVFGEVTEGTKEEIAVALENLRAKSTKITAGVDPVDVLLMVAAQLNAYNNYVDTACEVFGMDKKAVMRLANIGADAMADFSIDTAAGYEKATQSIKAAWEKIAGAKKTQAGKGVDNSTAAKKDDTGAEKDAGGSENNSGTDAVQHYIENHLKDGVAAAVDTLTGEENKPGEDTVKEPGAGTEEKTAE